ncbi:MAG: L-glutamate gamma-semialdehyde dehydrogenase, partial [Amphiplicatus sp.]
ENGATTTHDNQLIDPEHADDEVDADPVHEARALGDIPKPANPAPRDHFAGARLAAKGWDPADPETASFLEGAASRRAAVSAAPVTAGEPVPAPMQARVNPARRNEAIGAVALATPDLVARVCTDAARRQPEWAARPAKERAAILRRAGDMLEARTDDFLNLIVKEGGRTIPDAVSEIREAIDFLRYYPNAAENLDGAPLGVVACISPWNFPLSIFLGQATAAIAAGNAVVAKPAEATPLIGVEAVKLLIEAGVPKGVVNCLPGSGGEIGTPLVRHPAVRGVVFTGSTGVARVISRALVEAGKPDAALIAETGGINAMIVDSTALLEQAVSDAVSSAFQSAGQRCSACRLVCVQEDIAERFNEMLAGAMAALSIGDPARLSTDIGPLIDERARRAVAAHIEEMEKTARLIGRAPPPADDVDGAFIRPVAFEIRRVGDLTKEIFGPVLHVVRFAGERLDATVGEINALGYGLTLGAHTRIDETMHEIAARARVGNIYINRNQIGAVVGVQPFGGEGLSGTGPKAGGPHYVAALVKRPAPKSARAVAIVDGPVAAKDLDALAQAQAAYPAWSQRADRGAILRAAMAGARADARRVLECAARLHARHFAEALLLPGPAGESNTLRLKGRGVVLCLGDEGALPRQMALALAAGDAVLSSCDLALALGEALRRASAGGVALRLSGDGKAVNAALLADERVRAVVFDGAAASSAALAARLAARDGAIVPLLTSLDAPWRYAVERTLTINTTAAGGDVGLLSLPE